MNTVQLRSDANCFRTL